jgi:2-isopropylmalate synthase
MGFEIDGQALNTAFKRFKEIADRKKQVTAMDLEALVTDELRSEDIGSFTLDWFDVEASSLRPPHAKVSVTLPEAGSRTGRVHDRRRHRGPGRARRGLRRAGGARRHRCRAG